MKKSVKLAILLPVLAALLVGSLIQIVVIANNSSRTTNDLSESLVEQTVQHYANQFGSLGENSFGTLLAVAPIVKSYMGRENGREDVIRILTEAVSANDTLLGLWTCWEPNAFDGGDTSYINAQYHDSTGRFIPYVYQRGDSDATITPLTGYDDPVAGEYYLGALGSGELYVTDPYLYEVDGQNLTVYSLAMPVVIDGKAVGVVGADIDVSVANNLLNQAKILESGYVFTVSASGLITTHQKESLLLKNYRDTWLAQFEGNMESLAKNVGAFSDSAYSDVLNENVLLNVASIQVRGTGKNWLICGVVPMDEVEAPTQNLIAISIGACVALALLISGLLIYILRSKLKPLKEIRHAAEAMAAGNLRTHISFQSKDEFGALANSMRACMETIQTYILDIDRVMGEMAKSNFNIELAQPFIGDFENIEQSIHTFIHQISVTIEQIKSSAKQVYAGSDQVANGAQALAQGATQQAGAVEQLSASIIGITDNVKKNDLNTSKASEMAGQSTLSVENSNQHMQLLMNAMNEINEKSSEISKIIKTIDDIAFQTNILALNAAVEAARAGEAGKGFAVVADEVRNLASKSAEAAKDTTTLIESSILSIENGVKLAKDTAQDLTEVVEGSKAISEVIGEIARATSEQANALSQLAIGVEQISMVVQSNSATSQESAAASQELSSQANMMHDLVSGFVVKEQQ